MQYAISDMARYIKNILPPSIPEIYPIKTMFKEISAEEDIRKGVLAFRDLLNLICDSLITDGKLYDKPSKSKPSKDSHPSLPVSYPFINNIKSILFNIGYHGILIDNNQSMIIENLEVFTSTISAEGRKMKSKISGPKMIEALTFLSICGFHFDGIDLEKKRLDKSKSVKINFSDNPPLLLGLKVMAIAQTKLYSKGNHDIFLRCDYRVLKEEETDVYSILKDFVAPLPNDVQDFALNLHKHHSKMGLKCRLDIFYLGIRFIYSYKNKEIWTISAACESGYRLLIKAQNTGLYPDIISTFSSVVQEKISKGYGCNKKLFGEPCQKGCHGFSFPLDESITHINRDIQVWLDSEVSCYKK